MEERDNTLRDLCKSACINWGLGSTHFQLPYEMDTETRNHSLRVCLYSIAIANSLDLHKNRNLMKGFIEASLQHDIGKANVEGIGFHYEKGVLVMGGRPFNDRYHFVNKKTEFTQEDRRRMNEHIDTGIIFIDEPAKSIVALHHAWQKNPVLPLWLKSCKRTKETDYLSKLLAIADCFDAALNRVNTRNSDVPKKLDLDKAIEVVLEEYRNLPIVYKRNELPKIKTNGKELIDYLSDYEILEKIKVY